MRMQGPRWGDSRTNVLLIFICFALVLGINGCAGVTGITALPTGQTPIPPSISNLSVGTPSASGATITWTTNVPASSRVEYGTTTTYGSTTPLDSNLVASHSVTLGGLNAGTLYHYRVRSLDANNLEAVGPDATFTTAAGPDTNPPTISSVTAAVTTTGATVTWITNEPSDSQVEFGTTTSYGQTSSLILNMVTSHSVGLAGLNSSTLYHYRVKSRDAAGNLATSGDFTFTTSAGPDTTSPSVSISSPAAGASVSGTISVSANAADNVGVAGVQFKLSGNNLGAEDTSAPYTVSWNTTSVSNGTHTLTAAARDAAGNSATSTAVSVTVSNTAADTTPPSVPTGLSATAASSSQINLSWNASTDNVGVTGYRIYRGGAQITTTSGTSYQDAGLLPSTTYSYTVAASDAAGNLSAKSAAASATTLASTGGGIPTTLGWYQIPNTLLAPVCPNYPDIQGNSGCAAVIGAWNGGIADTKRNRLVFWGGGHNDYFGNEVYALNLAQNPITLTRLNEPTRNPDVGSCPETLWDGKINSRHNYSSMAYVQTSDRMFVFSGAKANCGYGSGDTWTLDLGALQWKRQDPTIGGPPSDGCAGCVADFDPNTGKVFLETLTALWRYDYATNTYARLNSSAPIDYHLNGVIDPKRKLFILFGGGQARAFDISATSNYSMQVWDSQLSGCSAIVNADYPGLAYDPVQERIVGWAGGNTVYLFNPDTKSCTSVTYAGGPGPMVSWGAFGRFRYFPALGVFALINDWQQNAYTLRLTPASSSGTPSAPVLSNIQATNITTSSAVINWTTDVAATSQIDYGTSTSYGSTTPLNSTLVTAHSQTLSGLAANTLYHYRVRSKNSSGVEAISNDLAFGTSNSTDNTPPTVSITAPSGGATVTGTIAVSANASDNVGVAGVQFLLDGANFGAEDTTAPYSISWDTTTVSDGGHTLAARARDAAGNTTTAASVSVTVSNGTQAVRDFQTRCQTSGVLQCVDFDSDAWYQQGVYLFQSDNGSYPIKDTSTKSSGTASLRFAITGNTGSNMGYWTMNFGQSFQENSTYYVQYAFRVNSVMAYTDWNALVGSSWKQTIFHYHGATCAGLEITTVRYQWAGSVALPVMYTDCGGNGPSFLQAGDYACVNSDYSDCFKYPADAWMTFYYKVHIGTWGQNNSSFESWVQLPGGTMKKWMSQFNYPLNQDAPGRGFDAITLLPYMTNKNETVNHPTGYMWFDELIVSSQPIPAPAGPTP